MLSGRIRKARHFERSDVRGGLIFQNSRAGLVRRRVCSTRWRPAAYPSLRPRLVRSSLSLPGPNPHRDGRIRTALALSGSQARPSVALPSARPCLPQTSRGMAVALESPPAAAPAHALPSRRRATTGSHRYAKCGRRRRTSRRRDRTYAAHGARHRNKSPEKCVPIRRGAAAKGKESARDPFQQQRSLGRAGGIRPQGQ
jgi:hypothetical protein